MSTFKAALLGQTDALLAFPDDGLAAADDDGLTPLHICAREGHVEAVAALLARRVPVDPADADGRTPLVLAAHSEHADICTLLMHHGADPSLVDATEASLEIRDALDLPPPPPPPTRPGGQAEAPVEPVPVAPLPGFVHRGDPGAPVEPLAPKPIRHNPLDRVRAMTDGDGAAGHGSTRDALWSTDARIDDLARLYLGLTDHVSELRGKINEFSDVYQRSAVRQQHLVNVTRYLDLEGDELRGRVARLEGGDPPAPAPTPPPAAAAEAAPAGSSQNAALEARLADMELVVTQMLCLQVDDLRTRTTSLEDVVTQSLKTLVAQNMALRERLHAIEDKLDYAESWATPRKQSEVEVDDAASVAHSFSHTPPPTGASLSSSPNPSVTSSAPTGAAQSPTSGAGATAAAAATRIGSLSRRLLKGMSKTMTPTPPEEPPTAAGSKRP